MSRIHDALLRVQQEREKAAGNSDPNTVMQVLQEQAIEPATPPPAAVIHEVPQDVPAPLAPAGDISYELLMSRCREQRWSLAPGIALSDDNGFGLEELRTLRTRLYQMRGNGSLKTVLIASAMPGEGKTYTSTRLAQVLTRQRGRKVLLIDGDLRIPRVHKALGAPQSPGLSDYLKGTADEFAVMQRGPLNGLMLIAGGSPADSPAELLAGRGLKNLVSRLAPCFDWVIIDTPAAVPLSDASVISSVCDGVLIVVSSGKTPFDLAQKTRREFEHSRILGVILNGVAPKSSYSSYYYGSYGSEQGSR